MSRDEALALLGLQASVAATEIQEALLQQVLQLEGRVANAPTEALKEKYRRQLLDLEAARQVLVGPGPEAGGLSQTKIADLPVAQASYAPSSTGPGASAGAAMTLQPGRVLAGRYEIREQIGAGGMGAVYRAYDKNRDKDIAIKVLLPHLLASGPARERFLNEARLASEMSHPHIVTVFDVQQDGPHFFLTMELLRGGTLRAALNRVRERRVQMPVDEALRIGDQISQALTYAHDRTVHRDVKPENIWIGDDGRAKLMDFGIARLLAEAQSGRASQQQSTGTAYYMAPEQLAGRADVDGRADQYALAATLYEAISGQVPTGRIEPLKKVRPGVPPALSAAIDQALSPRPELRYATMEQFRSALHKAPGFSLAALPKSAYAAAALVVLAIAGFVLWPAFVKMLPDREAEARAQQEATRLLAEAKAIFRQLETMRREVKESATNVLREIERVEGQLRSARSNEERGQAQGALAALRSKADGEVEIEQLVRTRLDDASGLAALEGGVSAAEGLIKEKRFAEAQPQLEGLVATLRELKALPEVARRQLAESRQKLLAQLDGKWGLASCDGASTWTVKGDEIQIYWPGAGMFEAAVSQAGKGTVTVTVQAPASYKGRMFRYSPQGARLDVEDVAQGKRQSLQRCG